MVNLHTFMGQCRLMTNSKNTIKSNFYLPIIYFMLTDSRLNAQNGSVGTRNQPIYINIYETSKDVPVSPFGPNTDERLK